MLDRKEWLEERRKSIGGSDAAALLGMNEWESPYSIWADKLGLLPEKEETEAMRIGRDLEEYVARRWMEATNKVCQTRKETIRNERYPWAHANIDRWVAGENAGLECKTTSSINLKAYKNGEFPDRYYVQCMHYMAVTGADRWYLAVLIMGREFKKFVIERDEEEIESLMRVEQEFWTKYVETKKEPPMDGRDVTDDAIDVVHAESNGTSISLIGNEKHLLSQRVTLTERRKALERSIKEIDQQLKATLGAAEIGRTEAYTVFWKPQSRSTFDIERFREDNPKIDLSPYYKTANYRRFEVKKNGR